MRCWRQLRSVWLSAGWLCTTLGYGQTVVEWTGGDGDFYDVAHWGGRPLPEATDIALLNSGATATVSTNAGDHELGAFRLGDIQGGTASGHVIMNGGALGIGGSPGDPNVVIGSSATLSTFIMNGGTILFDGPDSADQAGSSSGMGVNELDWQVGVNGWGRFEMHGDAVFRGADALKIGENAAGHGSCLMDGNARLSVGGGISVSGHGGDAVQTLEIGGNALVEVGNSMGAGDPAGFTDEGYLAMASGGSQGQLTIQDDAVLNIRRLTAREGTSTIVVKDKGQLHIFDVLTGKGYQGPSSPPDRPVVRSANSTLASVAPSSATLTLQDEAQMTVNSDPASGPVKGLAISGPRDAGDSGGTARLIIQDRASFRVEQDLGLGSGADPATSDGTLEIRGPAVQVSVGGNLNLAVDTDGKVAGVDRDGNPQAGQATLVEVITGATHSRLDVNGTARLSNGVLKVKLDGFTPNGGEVYVLIVGGSVEGPFKGTDFSEASLPAGLAWETVYVANAFVLNVVTQSQPSAFDLSKTRVLAGKLHLEWSGAGTLTGADTLRGSYSPVPGVSGNAADVIIDRGQRFFRIQQ